MASATTTHPIPAPIPAVTPPHPSAWRRALPWLIPTALLVAVAAGGAVRWVRARPKVLVHYETVVVDRGPIAAKVTATGAVSALVTVQVGSQVSGRIEKLYADFESVVHKGETVATIEPSFFRAAVAQARANHVSARATVDRAHAHVVQAEKDFARAESLVEDAIISRADYDAAEAALVAARADEASAVANVWQAKAALDQAELNLRYTTIVSPIDGVVISRNVDVGQTVAAALQAPTLFTIAQDLTRMQVDTNVAEADVGKVHAGMPVSFTVDAYPGREFAGVVRQVRDNATTLQNLVTYDAVIDVDNGQRLLKPGMTANAVFVHATRDDAVRIPNAAVRFKPDASTLAAMGVQAPKTTGSDRRTIWVIRGDHAESVVVRVGIADNTTTELVTGDLRPGDRVVVEASAMGKREP